jgi:pyroglutamyl-peptidase
MTSNREKRKFILTGFGPFGDIESNPSSELVRELGKLRSDIIATIPNIPVSERGVDNAIESILNSSITDDNILVIHLGVDETATHIKLEQFAYNEKNFRIPDMDGNVYDGEPISPGKPDRLSTQLVSSSIDHSMVISSSDPGGYICNMLYYKSLDSGLQSLFIHIPPFTVIAKREQVVIIQRILDDIV